MNLQSKIVVSIFLLGLIIWLLKSFSDKKLSTGQTVFWFMLLLGAEILTLLPTLVNHLSLLWGNLLPVSWISFAGLSFLIAYLFYQTIKLNHVQSCNVELTRNQALLEERLRRLESGTGEKAGNDSME